MKNILCVLILLGFSWQNSTSEIRVSGIIIEQFDVFEKQDSDWFFASPILNSMHSLTRQYVIEDELLFKIGDVISDDYLYETERNLRSLGLFTNVKIELEHKGNDAYDVYVVTKDRWSLFPSALFGSGGDYTNYGGKIEEYNLFGTGTKISGEALFLNENNIGWQGIFEISKRRLFRTDISLDFSLLSNKYKTEQNIDISKRYLTLDDTWSYGITLSNKFGSDFQYITGEDKNKMSLNEQTAYFWFSRAWWRYDRVFFTAAAEYHQADRADEKYERAFDNSGKLLFAFSSVSQDFFAIDKVNSYFHEDLIVGGWGTAILGKVFPIGSRGESFYYVAGQGERSYYNKNLYLFGQLTGAGAFFMSNSYFTYQDFTGLGFYKITDDLLFTARIKQQAVWNWYRLRQLLLDTDQGLRGYRLKQFAGDNRLISNIELRYFPNIEFWMFNFSAVGFFDVGSVWRQDTKIRKSRFYSSAGLGLRMHFNKSSNPKHIFRLDFAYNFDEKRFGGIIFSTEQMFSAFKNHEFKLPKLYGMEFDY